ncbi:MAG: hypothetical protein ACK40U_08380, partial [Fervidobacterium pennivorans]
MTKGRKLLTVLLGILIALVVIFILFLYGYSSFLVKQVYGENAHVLSAWRNYVSFLLSQIPFIKNFVKYDTLEIMTAQEYFERIYQQYAKELEEKLKQIAEKEQEIANKNSEIERLLKSLKSIEESWKEKRLSEELNKVQDTISLKRLQDIVDTFANSDPTQLRRLMNSDNMSVETLAVVFSKLQPDVRADVLQQLTAVNPVKAAQVVEKIGGIDQIISDLDFRIEELKKTIQDLVSTEAELITLSGFSKGLSSFLSSMDYDELWNFIMKIKSKPDLVYYILSNVDNQTMIRLLRDIKDRNEELFIEII